MDSNNEGFLREAPDKKYTDVGSVESQRNDIIPEEFPEGPYGSSFEMRSFGKSTPWRVDQRSNSAYNYENREFHADLPRVYPGDHPTHDSSTDETNE